MSKLEEENSATNNELFLSTGDSAIQSDRSKTTEVEMNNLPKKSKYK
jgi:hypothetical protein